MRRARWVLTVLLLAGVATVAVGCGDDGSAGAAEEELSPSALVAEIGQVRDRLDHALEEYREGEVAAAEEIVGDAYLEHFELVEHPLEERDHELMEDLELLISTTIRNRIKDGAPAGEVAALVHEAKGKLAQAESLLRDS